MANMIEVVENEFGSWCEGGKNTHNLFMVGCELEGDGRIRLDLMGENDLELTVRCPADYPQHSSTFHVKAGRKEWTEKLEKAVNQAAIPSTLLQIMNLINQTLSGKEESSSIEHPIEADDSAEENDEEMDDFSDAGYSESECDDYAFRSETVDLLYKKGKWMRETGKYLDTLKTGISQKVVQEFEEANKTKKKDDLTNVTDPITFLLNEVQRINENSAGIKAEAIDDVIYHLAVTFSNFKDGSPLQKDLKKCGVDGVRFNLFFNPFLYPYSPPEVEMVSPRLVGLGGEPFIALDVFKPLKESFWYPTRYLLLYLTDIRAFFESHLRVEMNSPLGDRYLTLEDSVHQLGMLLELSPRMSQAEDYDISAVQPAIKNTNTAKTTVWAKGKGYGSYKDSKDKTQADKVEYFKFTKKKREERIWKLLDEVQKQAALIVKILEAKDVARFSTSAIAGKESWFWFDSLSKLDGNRTGFAKNLKNEGAKELLEKSIKNSVLIDFLENFFGSSYLEFNLNFELFETCSKILLEFCSGGHLIKVLSGNSEKSIFSIFKNLNMLASKALELSKVAPKTTTQGEKYNEAVEIYILDICKEMNKHQALMETPVQNLARASKGTTETLEERYCKALKPLLFDNARFVSKYPADKIHRSKQQIMRLANEISVLSTSLPCQLSSSIFVRTDMADISRIRFMIIGPEGTPYSNGCYFFDLKFPENYPHSPPLVHFRMAGSLQFSRINPNLYVQGKVCLSLLGTWPGATSESWNSTCTALQILVSIQSLILNEEPYYNEPGYESNRATMQQSKNYNKNVRVYNVNYGIVHVLDNPYPEFREAIRTHFFLKKDAILQELRGWNKESSLNLANLEQKLARLKM